MQDVQVQEAEDVATANGAGVLREDSYTLHQVAEAIGKDISTVREYLRQNVFPHAYKDGPNNTSAWRVPQRDLDAYDEMRLATMPGPADSNE
jgi:hypothetical protein